MKRLILAACLGSALFVASRAHAAGAADACAAASEDGQLLKMKGQLLAAREKLLACAKPSCPKVIRADCNTALDEIERSLPSVVLSAHDSAGKDLTDVEVTLDGAAFTKQLDGKALPVDPGRHTFHFETEGAPAHDETIVVREGEKSRIVSVLLGEEARPEKPKEKTEKKSETPGETQHGPSSATWIVGGIGVAALATAGVVGFVALRKRSSLYDSCGRDGTCAQSDVDGVYRLYDVSYVAAGIGGALLITSGVLYFTTSSSGSERAVSVAPSLGGVRVFGRF